ncbi:RHS repeat-associated core domain-containing protein [Actinokineospora auranticolor]|uniref:RHS repeat-associated core domain-containing protein n=1 Tax=Actinokineospora auranticolor TaxID=155976 RepID=UPI0015E39AB0|nr:RHS repeat-associated core domain-containing protein [Actinokineospora auranticolor]
MKLVRNAGGSYTARFLDSGETWDYDAFGWPLNRKDRNGNAITGEGDWSRPRSLADPLGRQRLFEYDTAIQPGAVTKVVTPRQAVPPRRRSRRTRTTRWWRPTRTATRSRTPSTPLAADLEKRSHSSPKRLLTEVTDAKGAKTWFGYDGPGNLITVTPPAPLGQARYGYDSLSRITSITDGAGKKVDYTYDKAGNLKTLTDPAGTATYNYDAANRLTSLADAFGQTTTFAYDNADRRTTTTWPGAGTQSNTYDNAGRLTALVAKNTGGTELLKATYSYTAGTADSDLLQSKTIAGVTTDYTYDTQRHLTKAGTTTFAVDRADNITNLAGTAHTVNTANQLTGTGSQTFGYDGAGNLTSVTHPATAHEYSTTNQLVRTTTGGTQTFAATYDTVNQTQPRTITESGTDHVFTHTALGTSSVVRGGTRISVSRDPDGKLITEKSGNNRYNLVTDHQGSVLGLVDTTGALAATYTYTPYGATPGITSIFANHNPFRYNGGYTLASGQTVFDYRYYTPTLGRFTNPDPTGQERNSYAYAGSDPINNSDPTGAYSWADFGQGVGGWGGAAIGAAIAGAACVGTGGAACLIGGVTVSVVTGGTGAVIGGDSGKVRDAFISGAVGGALGGGVGGLLGKAYRKLRR